MTKGDGGKDCKRFEWAALLRCLSSGLSTVVQSGNYKEKDLHLSFRLICCLLMLNHDLAYFTSWTNIGLTVIERPNGFNFKICCAFSNQKHHSLHRAFLWGSVSLKFWFFFYERGRSFSCRICYLESSQLETLNFAKSKAFWCAA